jgi:hypothetical protein
VPADTLSSPTLHGRTRRYRIFVAAQQGKPFRFFEFSLWVQEQWARFRDARGIVHALHATPSVDVFLALGMAKAQQQIDDWLEAQFGCAPKTDLDPLDRA